MLSHGPEETAALQNAAMSSRELAHCITYYHQEGLGQALLSARSWGLVFPGLLWFSLGGAPKAQGKPQSSQELSCCALVQKSPQTWPLCPGVCQQLTWDQSHVAGEMKPGQPGASPPCAAPNLGSRKGRSV